MESTPANPAASALDQACVTQQVLDGLSERVFWKATDGRYLGCNLAFARDAGVTSVAAVIGLRDTDLAWREQAAAIADEERPILDGLSPGRSIERRLRLDSGGEIEVSYAVYPLRDLNGALIGLHGRYQDLTARRAQESALRELARSQAEAEAADRAKGDFLTTMSHAIRTPLGDMLSMLDLLGSSALDREQSGFVASARNSAAALLTLLNDILDFSRIEAGQLHIDSIEFDLHALLQDVTRGMAPRAQDKDIELICDVGPQLPRHLRGDPGRLRQILVNLLDNALKFTHSGEVALSVTCLAEHDDRRSLRFSVRDTGIGIAPERHSLLFGNFSQANGALSDEFNGGLGLAISRQLCGLMAGAMAFTSMPGRGSNFWFDIAFKLVEGAPMPLPIGDIRGAHVLVVDDNLTHREVMSAYLRVWGVRCETAASAAAALAYVRFAHAAGEPVRAAIIDLKMPGRDGLALGRMIRDLAMDSLPALILMSSSARRGDARAAREAGFAAYLAKPTHADDLHACLCQVLGLLDPRTAVDSGFELITRHSLRERRAGGTHLLVVEDNVVNQELLRGMLARLGYGADIAVNGDAALEALATRDYALVLMDCQMPEMDGYAASRAIRDGRGHCDSGVRDRGIPIIAMTAHPHRADRVRCLAAGMSDYLPKPIDAAELEAMLTKWLPETATAARRGSAFTAANVRDTVLDLASLRRRLGNDEALLAAVIETFLRDTPARLGALGAAIARGASEEVHRQAHQLKGAAANIGARQLAAQAAQTDDAAALGDSASLQALGEAIVRAFEDVRRRVDELQWRGQLPQMSDIQV